ncbi:MAG: dynamin family protein, partial [Candidatus Udaeobacter sp.]
MSLLERELTSKVAPPESHFSDVQSAHSNEPTWNVNELLGKIAEYIRNPTSSQANILQRIDVLRERLKTERFQLAVLGQFKRGKSTVLNGLLGRSVLPIGVVPVTAIPTFLEAAQALKIRVTYDSGKVSELAPESAET